MPTAFSSLTDRLSNAFKSLRSKGKLSQSDIDGTIREIRRALLDADVAVEVVREFTAAIRERALSTEVSEALNPAQQVVSIVNDELTKILGSNIDRPLHFAKNPPTVIMLAGLQGAGKTTLAGKLGYWLKDAGHTPLLVAADLQRPNAVTQLQVVGERAGVPVYAPEPGVQEGGEQVENPGLLARLTGSNNRAGDPVKVAKDSLKVAKEKLYDTVIIDTAGRRGVDEELMAQARAIRNAVNPDEVLFVIDAMIGQDAVTTAEAFNKGVDFTGVVLSKLDGDARGGAALSVASVTHKPILFASTGEGLKDFEVFHPDRMASRILDMGDILTLIEQAQRQFDEEKTRKAAAKLTSGNFGLDDFLSQLQQVRKLGPMKNLLAMVPGMGGANRQALENFDEKMVDRTEAIIQSMTPAERRDPKIINGSRRARIAYGAGVTVSEINGLLDRFNQAAKMMKRMGSGKTRVPGLGRIPQGVDPQALTEAGGNFASMPGMGGLGSSGGSSKKKSKKKGASKSGNPAKRAAEEAALRARLAGGPKQNANDSGSGSGHSAFEKPAEENDTANSANEFGLPGGLPPSLTGGLFGRR
jgi:signal recognition particle subunit SRP54